mmetsp:Transcript_9101/g.26861  ORF Transcript_9101/g.26861 Transcript_9101/m.26861 type:complete len:241 (-) Transcript_9101:542-1264(-)
MTWMGFTQPLKLTACLLQLVRLQEQQALVDGNLYGLLAGELVLQGLLRGHVDALQGVEERLPLRPQRDDVVAGHGEHRDVDLPRLARALPQHARVQLACLLGHTAPLQHAPALHEDGRQLLVVLQKRGILLSELLGLNELGRADPLCILEFSLSIGKAPLVDQGACEVEGKLVGRLQKCLLVQHNRKRLLRLVARDARGHGVDQEADVLGIVRVQRLVHLCAGLVVTHAIADLSFQTSMP